MTILGIDPGTATIGYGLVKKTGTKKLSHLSCLAQGLITTSPNLIFPRRLEKISGDLRRILRQYQPDLVAIESLFFFRNLKTFIPVSRASGVIILEVSRLKIPLVEFTPMQVKSRVANYGRAEKKDVQKRIQQILKLKKLPEPDDVADALGVALCAALSRP